MNVKQSIIIPHRNRIEYLKRCLRSIYDSASYCEIIDFEIVVVDDGSDILPYCEDHTKILRSTTPMQNFNKPVLLNQGIEASEGGIITFLDSDAIVGRRWMALDVFLDVYPDINVIAHKVKVYPSLPQNIKEIDDAFDHYNDYPNAHEGRGEPHINRKSGEPLFGNSQWTIRRSDLGDLRFNEEMDGHGYEDIWFMHHFWQKMGYKFKAWMPTEPEQSMFVIDHPRKDPLWNIPALTNRNREIYNADKRNREKIKSVPRDNVVQAESEMAK